MVSVYDLKPRFQGLLRPLIGGLAGRGVTANAVTLAAVAGSIVAGGLVLLARAWPVLFLVLPVWLFLRMALNAIDGMMARELGMASQLGAVLNELGDVLSDLALYVPLAALHEPARWPALAFALGAVLTEFCGVLVRALGGERAYDGPMGKSDRAFVVGTLATLTFLWPGAYALWPGVLTVATLLTAVTCWKRASRAVA
jgi:CDP-diacylglycerol--glycerol-3-phosphate 3-phosphatidyltransferase